MYRSTFGIVNTYYMKGVLVCCVFSEREFLCWFGRKINAFKYIEVMLAILSTPGASHIWR